MLRVWLVARCVHFLIVAPCVQFCESCTLRWLVVPVLCWLSVFVAPYSCLCKPLARHVLLFLRDFSLFAQSFRSTHHQTMTGSHRSLEPQLQTTARFVLAVHLARHTHTHIPLHVQTDKWQYTIKTVKWNCTITDPPWHKNMITGASQADVARLAESKDRRDRTRGWATFSDGQRNAVARTRLTVTPLNTSRNVTT